LSAFFQAILFLTSVGETGGFKKRKTGLFIPLWIEVRQVRLRAGDSAGRLEKEPPFLRMIIPARDVWETCIPLNSLLRRRPAPRTRVRVSKMTLIHGKTTLLFLENRTMSPVWLDSGVI
jgi:hypothetical protein